MAAGRREGGVQGGSLPDPYDQVPHKLVRRNNEVLRGRPLSYATGAIILRAVAGAEPATEIALRIARLLPFRDSAKVRAHTDDHKPLRSLDTRTVRFRVY